MALGLLTEGRKRPRARASSPWSGPGHPQPPAPTPTPTPGDSHPARALSSGDAGASGKVS
jgi:hypothetical protein